jgi:hypothetical protein
LAILADREGGALAAAGQLDGSSVIPSTGGTVSRGSSWPAGLRQAGRRRGPGGEAGDRGRVHGGLEGVLREVGGAGVAALLAVVDGDADALVAVVFDGVHFVTRTLTDWPKPFGDIHLAGRCAALAGELEMSSAMFEVVLTETETLVGHGSGWGLG